MSLGLRAGDHVDVLLEDVSISMEVTEVQGDVTGLSCLCCGGRGTVAAVGDGTLLIGSRVTGTMRFREPDFEIVERDQASLSDYLEAEP